MPPPSATPIPRDNPDIHFADVVRNGIGLSNQKLVRKWVDNCGLTDEKVGWGLDLIRDGNGFRQIPWEGHTYPRMVNHHRVTGKYLMKCLGERSASLGIALCPTASSAASSRPTARSPAPGRSIIATAKST